MTEYPIIAALALMMVFEGLMPFLAPKVWKNLLNQLAQMEQIHLRLFGAVLMISGALIFNYVHS